MLWTYFICGVILICRISKFGLWRRSPDSLMSRNSLEIRTGRPGLASPDSWAEHDGHAATRLTRTPTILRPRDCIHAKHCIAVLQASVSFSISGTANVIIRQLICIPNTIAIMQCSYNFSTWSLTIFSSTMIMVSKVFFRSARTSSSGSVCLSVCLSVCNTHSS